MGATFTAKLLCQPTSRPSNVPTLFPTDAEATTQTLVPSGSPLSPIETLAPSSMLLPGDGAVDGDVDGDGGDGDGGDGDGDGDSKADGEAEGAADAVDGGMA